jgi:hypothetical protein
MPSLTFDTATPSFQMPGQARQPSLSDRFLMGLEAAGAATPAPTGQGGAADLISGALRGFAVGRQLQRQRATTTREQRIEDVERARKFRMQDANLRYIEALTAKTGGAVKPSIQSTMALPVSPFMQGVAEEFGGIGFRLGADSTVYVETPTHALYPLSLSSGNRVFSAIIDRVDAQQPPPAIPIHVANINEAMLGTFKDQLPPELFDALAAEMQFMADPQDAFKLVTDAAAEYQATGYTGPPPIVRNSIVAAHAILDGEIKYHNDIRGSINREFGKGLGISPWGAYFSLAAALSEEGFNDVITFPLSRTREEIEAAAAAIDGKATTDSEGKAMKADGAKLIRLWEAAWEQMRMSETALLDLNERKSFMRDLPDEDTGARDFETVDAYDMAYHQGGLQGLLGGRGAKMIDRLKKEMGSNPNPVEFVKRLEALARESRYEAFDGSPNFEYTRRMLTVKDILNPLPGGQPTETETGAGPEQMPMSPEDREKLIEKTTQEIAAELKIVPERDAVIRFLQSENRIK